MRNRVAKSLKRMVLDEMKFDFSKLTDKEKKTQIKIIFSSRKFKSIYRARKKNYLRWKQTKAA